MIQYTLVQWPESQKYMEEDWFEEEALLVLDHEEFVGSSAYFIPTERVMGKLYPESVVLDLLVSMEQSLNPEIYPTSKDLTPEDFLDLALCKASELGIEDKFKKHSQKVIKNMKKLST